MLTAGMMNFVAKPVSGNTLLDAINTLSPAKLSDPILIVDDDPHARELYQDIVGKDLPGYPIRTASDGAAALAMMAKEIPSLVILDLIMPEVDGFEVLDWMHANRQTRQVPVLVLSGRPLTFDDVQRLERYAKVMFQSKGILSETSGSFFVILIDVDMNHLIAGEPINAYHNLSQC